MNLKRVSSIAIAVALLLTGCTLASWVLTGCARIVVTRDANRNETSVRLESPFGGTGGKPPNVAAQSQSIEQMEVAVRERINSIRKKQGLKPLRANETLTKIARNYSRRMNKENFFSHYDPAGKSAADRVRAAGLSFRAVGENIAKNYNATDPIQMTVQGWMNSKGHRENILREEYTETGVGIWKDGKSYYFTQLFMRPL